MDCRAWLWLWLLFVVFLSSDLSGSPMSPSVSHSIRVLNYGKTLIVHKVLGRKLPVATPTTPSQSPSIGVPCSAPLSPALLYWFISALHTAPAQDNVDRVMPCHAMWSFVVEPQQVLGLTNPLAFTVENVEDADWVKSVQVPTD